MEYSCVNGLRNNVIPQIQHEEVTACVSKPVNGRRWTKEPGIDSYKRYPKRKT